MIQKKVVIGIWFILLTSMAQADRLYGPDGSYQGRVDSRGNFFDKEGNSIGRVDDKGRIYGKNGSYLGRKDDDNKVDENINKQFYDKGYMYERYILENQ